MPSSDPRTKAAKLGGVWRDLPRSPFSAADPVAVWAGDRMVVINHIRGRTATYYPPTRRWEEHQRIPGESDAQGWTFDVAPRAVWTDDKVVVYGGRTGRDSDWVDWYAFDVAGGRWHDVVPPPFGRHGGQMTWTGDLLLVVAGDRTAAAYDPSADCWLEMPEAPPPVLPDGDRILSAMEWGVSSTHWTGDELLAVVIGEWTDFPVGVVSFDPDTWLWAPRSVGSIAGDLVDPVFADGKLWFMTEDPNDRYITNATWDLATDTWSISETGCPLNARWATWTGQLIIEPYSDRRAFDPSTGACFRTPPSKDRARQWEPVWTGREFMYWSGAYGDTSHGRPDGIVYRPPRAAVTAEKAKPVGKKLARAISSRRRFGLDTDPDVVREIAQDPYQPESRQFGFPMSEDEYWDLNDRSWFSLEARSVISYVRKLPVFGGIWIDQRHGGRLAIALTEANPDVVAMIDAKMPAEPDLGWRLVIVPRTWKEVRQAFRRVPKVSRELDATAMLWLWAIDEMNGRIMLTYDPDDVQRMRARKDEIEKRLGVPVVIDSGRVRDT